MASFNPDDDEDDGLDDLKFEDESSGEDQISGEDSMNEEALADEESEIDDDLNQADDDLHEHSSELDSSEEDKTDKLKRKSKVEKMSQIASKHGYSGDFFNSNAGDFASAEDFEQLLDISDSELVQVHSKSKKLKRK